MKKVLLMFALLLGAMGAKADGVTVADATAKQGGAGKIQLLLNLTSENKYRGATFNVVLPEGLSIPNGVDDKTPAFTIGAENSSYQWNGSYQDNNAAMFLGFSMGVDMVEGVLLEIPIQASANFNLGDEVTGQVTNLLFSYMDAEDVEHNTTFDDVTFTVTIVDYDVQLDEDATETPAVAANVDVNVKRTINAGEWSTIVLPFDMDADQVKAAFGDEVELGDLTGSETIYGEDDAVVGINVTFDKVTAIEANHPYIIKVPSDVNSFTVYGVNIDPEEDPCVEFDNGKSGSRRIVYSAIYGTYVAGTVVDDECLFLSDNKFWYSVGETVMKGYRAYFAFYDVLDDKSPAAAAKVNFVVNDEATAIAGLKTDNTLDGVYTVNGQFVGDKVQMSRLPKGVYIVNGKKYLNK